MERESAVLLAQFACSACHWTAFASAKAWVINEIRVRYFALSLFYRFQTADSGATASRSTFLEAFWMDSSSPGPSLALIFAEAIQDEAFVPNLHEMSGIGR
jgi:hypothetical protein